MTSRESIWSVPQSWRELYFALFSIQFIICAGVVIWYEVFVNTGDNAYETYIAIGRGVAPFVIVVVAETVILVEVIFMLSERYLLKRYRQGIAEGEARGIAEGEARGIAQGIAEGEARGIARGIAQGEVRGTAQGSADTQRRWEAWNHRRMTAQAEGLPFNEPPPSPSTPENGSN